MASMIPDFRILGCVQKSRMDILYLEDRMLLQDILF